MLGEVQISSFAVAAAAELAKVMLLRILEEGRMKKLHVLPEG